MPQYSYECVTCGESKDEYRRVDERNNAPDCNLCGTAMIKTISMYAVVPDLEPYYDEHLQTAIRSKQHRKRVMSEQGVSERFGMNWSTAASSKRKRSGRL